MKKNIETIIKKWLKNNNITYAILNVFYLISECSFILYMWILGNYFDALQTNKEVLVFNFQLSKKYFYIATFIILAVYIISILMFEHLNFKFSNKFMMFMESEVLKHSLDIEYENISNRNKIELAQQINNDCVIIADFIIEKLPALIVNIIKALLIINLIRILSPSIFFVVLLTSLFFPILYFINRKRYKELNMQLNDKRMKYFGVLGGELLNIFLVKVNVWQNRTIKKFNEAGEEFVEASVKFLDLDNLLNNIYFMVSTAMIIIAPVIFINSNKNIAYLVIIIALINQYYPTCSSIFKIVSNMDIYSNAKYRINELFKLSVDKNGDQIIESIHEISSDNLKFKYKNSDRIILNNLKLDFKMGKLYIIKGINGSGKSTLLKIILGILYSDDTQFYINKVSNKELDLKHYRKNLISYCEQEPYIIDDTLKENILYNSDEKELVKYRQLIENLMVNSNVAQDTFISQNSLSGGEKQKVSILRALYKDAQIYIFDEPTSSLDVKSSFYLRNVVTDLLLKNKMVLIISHDNTFDDLADEIININ